MAGKKQHFIPQHFQRPFLIPDSNEKIWLYRHDVPDGVPVSLKKSAAKEHFYSKLSTDGSPTLDDLVTEYEENNLTGKVNSIRALPVGSKICAADIAEIVTHLTIRSAHIREFVNEGARSMVGVVDKLINTPEQVDSLP
ncbi:hypothetical protein KA005_57155, partial [bacterium]|nr:hypothetical protein [bacterium]